MTTIRLAIGGNAIRMVKSLLPDQGQQPALLVSWVYWDLFVSMRPQIAFRDYVLDLGAFTAHASGKPVELIEYAEFVTELLSKDEQLSEVYSLDVIGDWRATLKNTEWLWSRGIPAIPAYHAGQPVEALDIIARDYPKIALGGAVGLRAAVKTKWARECLRRVWPKPVHGFGFGTRDSALAAPFHSIDASNWEAGPGRFGNWSAFGKLPVRGGWCSVRAEVDVVLEWEREAGHRWSEMTSEIQDQVDAYRAAMEKARSA